MSISVSWPFTVSYQKRARLTPEQCPRGAKRFTVVRVQRDPSDTHAARSFENAMELALPDPGSHIEVFVVCARDAGAARLHPERGMLVKRFQYRGRRR